MSELIKEGTPSLSEKRTPVVVVIILLGVCASVVLYQITAQGPGVSSDSTVYIEAARNILTGTGLFVDDQPMTHYPPVFPLLLAGIGSFTGNDLLLAARLLSALFFGLNLVLVALAVYICTRHDMLATSLVIPIMLLSAPVLSIHSMAWSEAPFIAFSMAGFILLSQHVADPNPKHLVLASLMAGFAAATRYIGIIIFPVSVLALLVLSHKSVKYKIGDIILFLGVACPPLVSWLIRNILVAQTATNRQFAFHPFGLDHINNLIVQMYNFVIPIPIPRWVKALQVGLVGMLFVLAIGLLYQKTDIKQSKLSIRIILPAIFTLYSVLYISFLFLSISFFDAHTSVNHRLLLPVFLALLIVFTSVAKGFAKAYHQKWVWYGYALFVLFSVSINVVQAVPTAVSIHHEGTGYTARYWRESATLAVLARVPETMRIYSNGRDVIRFHTQKKAYTIPKKVFPGTCKENENYQEEMSQMIEECEKGKAIIVYFDRITWRWTLPSKEEIESQSNILLANVVDDGVIYGLSVMQNHTEQGAALDGNSAVPSE